MKTHIKFSAILAAMLGTAGGLLVLLSAHATTPSSASLPSKPRHTPNAKPAPAPVALAPAAAQTAPAVPAVSSSEKAVADNPGVLDSQRQFALSMIETGIDDKEVGKAGEVSRYQIMPSVWRHYSSSHNYRNPAVALQVARQHWASLYESFKRRAHREPTDFDMYVLWNTRFGYYASCGFNPHHLQPVVKDRAERFVNLVELGATQYATR